jgi:hypothetical protein
MADVKLTEASVVTVAADDHVAGTQGGAVKRFAVSDLTRSAALAASSGAALVGFSHTPAAAAGTVAAKLQRTIHVMDAPYNAVGDGATDDTAAIQAAIDALPAWGELDGSGKTYVVTSLELKSFLAMRRFNLKTKAGTVDFVAPITIDGTGSTIRNITLTDVNVDGNRQNQTAITDPDEDGGRHGFRILGSVVDVTLDRCSATYCAGDGLELFSSTAKPAADTYSGLCFQNVRLINCVFDWNRRHGVSGDSINGIKMIGCDARNNGKDLDGSSALDSGMRGARFGGNLYGRPFDFEGYGVGTAVHDVEIIGGDYADNVGGALFYDTVDPAAVGFVVRKAIRVSNAHFDLVDSTADGCFVVSSALGTVALPVYEDVNLSNCTLDNWIQFSGVNGINVQGGSVVADYLSAHFASVSDCSDWRFNIRSNKQSIGYDALPATVTRANIAGSPTFSSEAVTLLGFTDSGYRVRYSAAVSGAIAAVYFCTLTCSAGFKLRPINVALIDNNTGASEQSSLSSDGATVLSLSFGLTTTDAHAIEVIYEVVKNA